VLARYRLQTGEPEEALTVLEGVQEQHGDNAAVLEVLSMAQVSAGQLDQGITTLRRLAELRPDSPEVNFRLAIAQGQAERLGEARRSLERVLARDENHAGALVTLARLERQEGREEQALTLAKRMQDLDATRAVGHLMEGDIRAAREDYTEAARAYESSYEAQVSSEVAMKRFEVRRRAGDEAEARKQMREHLENFPDDHQSRMMLATTVLSAGDMAAAREDYEILVERFPDNPIVLNNLSYIYQREGDERSLDLAQRAHELQPESPSIKDTLGMALLDHGDPSRALELIREAREALPDEAAVGYHYAVALERNGRQDEAASVLRELLAEAGEFTERQEAEELLSRLES
jgi:putative PEP-CTERM system TPR-repeat lipoprotein